MTDIYDRYDTWGSESQTSYQSGLPKNGVLDRLKNAVGAWVWSDELNKETITLADVHKNFADLLGTRPCAEQQVDTCCVSVARKNSKGFEICLILLDADNEPVKETESTYCGVKLKAKHMDESLMRFLGEKSTVILSNPYCEK